MGRVSWQCFTVSQVRHLQYEKCSFFSFAYVFMWGGCAFTCVDAYMHVRACSCESGWRNKAGTGYLSRLLSIFYREVGVSHRPLSSLVWLVKLSGYSGLCLPSASWDYRHISQSTQLSHRCWTSKRQSHVQDQQLAHWAICARPEAVSKKTFFSLLSHDNP